ncbi:hypothetical protein KEJ42_01615 [Candidatus Bathyarchaeota archaeon]|nr:hypothetical protein [Candidatus Bathyarchaeota archaeon]
MRRSILTLPYILSAWILMVGYQIFTQISLVTLIDSLNNFMPSLGAWLTLNLSTINFIHNFAWVFVLSSIAPSILLGKDRSVIVHFIFCLAFTLVSAWIRDIVLANGSNPVTTISYLFHNPLIATLYILAPYIIMLTLDIHINRARARKTKEMIMEIEIARHNEGIMNLEDKTVS